MLRDQTEAYRARAKEARRRRAERINAKKIAIQMDGTTPEKQS